MEIYANGTPAERTITLPVPIDAADISSIDVDIKRDGETVYTFATVTPVSGGYSVTIPLSYTLDGGDLTVDLKIDYTEDTVPYEYRASKTVEVVTPILSTPDILKIHPQATPDEVIAIEKIVRYIINAHTGQRFTKFTGERAVRGTGGTSLLLPERLNSLTTINGVVPGPLVELDPFGFLLKRYRYGAPPVKADAYGWHMHTGGVIHNPHNVRWEVWEKSQVYKIGGVWGYEEVPPAVTEAARLLVDDYARVDSAYRNRYLTSMTAADWRIQFHAGAFDKTGNVLADQLLSDYVLQRGWVVV